MDEDYGCEELWDDAEEFERDQLAEDHEEEDEFEDMDEADAYIREDFGFFGEMGVNEE